MGKNEPLLTIPSMERGSREGAISAPPRQSSSSHSPTPSPPTPGSDHRLNRNMLLFERNSRKLQRQQSVDYDRDRRGSRCGGSTKSNASRSSSMNSRWSNSLNRLVPLGDGASSPPAAQVSRRTSVDPASQTFLSPYSIVPASPLASCLKPPGIVSRGNSSEDDGFPPGRNSVTSISGSPQERRCYRQGQGVSWSRQPSICSVGSFRSSNPPSATPSRINSTRRKSSTLTIPRLPHMESVDSENGSAGNDISRRNRICSNVSFKDLPPKERRHRKVAIAVVVFSSFLFISSVTSIFVSLHKSPHIDEKVRRENDKLLKDIHQPAASLNETAMEIGGGASIVTTAASENKNSSYSSNDNIASLDDDENPAETNNHHGVNNNFTEPIALQSKPLSSYFRTTSSPKNKGLVGEDVLPPPKAQSLIMSVLTLNLDVSHRNATTIQTRTTSPQAPPTLTPYFTHPISSVSSSVAAVTAAQLLSSNEPPSLLVNETISPDKVIVTAGTQPLRRLQSQRRRNAAARSLYESSD